MTRYHNYFCLLLVSLLSLTSVAQTNGCNSSYSRFGLGLQQDQSQGFTRSMGGVGIGIRVGNRVNMLNPASYAGIDSLSMILDAGFQASFAHMSLGSQNVNTKNCNLDYVNAGLRIAKGLGLSLGFVPYTSIGYNFTSPDESFTTNGMTTQNISVSNSYVGSGGLHQTYVGLGWEAWRKISIGANISFLWGDYTHSVTPYYKEGGITSTNYSGTVKMVSTSMKTYKIDLGVQYPIRLSKQDILIAGVTAGLGHKIAQDVTMLHYTTAGDTTTFVAKKPLEIPYSFGGGVSWQHTDRLLVAADIRTDLWGNCHMPVEKGNGVFEATKGYLKNRTKIALGAQFTPNPYDKHYRNRIQYRAGMNYTTPYMIVNGITGPREIGLTLGAGLPITNSINNRSIVNVGIQWLNRSAASSQLVSENYLLLNIGMTFNERWFMKFKIN